MSKRTFDYNEYDPGMRILSMKEYMCEEIYEGMAQIVAYLYKGKKIYLAAGRASDFYTGEMIQGECCGMTEGVYSWVNTGRGGGFV